MHVRYYPINYNVNLLFSQKTIKKSKYKITHFDVEISFWLIQICN